MVGVEHHQTLAVPLHRQVVALRVQHAGHDGLSVRLKVRLCPLPRLE